MVVNMESEAVFVGFLEPWMAKISAMDGLERPHKTASDSMFTA